MPHRRHGRFHRIRYTGILGVGILVERGMSGVGMMTGYFDESANDRTVLVGGWIANDLLWERVTRLWTDRIAFENRISTKKGLPELSRYHAAECASRRGEFTGWTTERQVRLVKRFQDILRWVCRVECARKT